MSTATDNLINSVRCTDSCMPDGLYSSAIILGAGKLIARDLRAYWKLDESSNGSASVTRQDSVGLSPMLDPLNAPSATGKISQGVHLNGTTQYLGAAHNSFLSIGTHNLTICAWAKLDAFPLSTVGVIVAKGAISPNYDFDYAVWYGHGPNSFRGAVSDGTNLGRATGLAGIVTGQWYFVVFQHQAGVEVRISINNGAFQRVAYTFPCLTNTYETMIGTSVNGAAPALKQYYFDGVIDEVGIWDRCLSALEIDYLYNSGAGKTYPFV